MSNTIYTERHRICVGPETSPVSVVSAGGTAYSIVKKIGYLLDKLFDAIKEFITDNVASKEDVSGLVTKQDVDSAKQEILEAIITRGGGGLTPEQWAQIAKEETLTGLASTLAAYQTANTAKLDTITSMLTLEDGEVTAELQTLIPNEEETV